MVTEEKKGLSMKPEDSNYSFSQHRDCEFFPCHKTEKPEDFNCLFCYCPLYALGKECGGNFVILENGVKDCSDCTVPHRKENYGYITEQFQHILRLIQQNE